MPSPRQRFGSQAEDQAEQFLLQKGYAILDRHITSRYGEIDILAQDGEAIVAVEVKKRRNTKFGSAAESVTIAKLGRLRNALAETLERHHWADRPHRIDLVAFDGDIIDHRLAIG